MLFRLMVVAAVLISVGVWAQAALVLFPGEIIADSSLVSNVSAPAMWATLVTGLGLIGGNLRSRRGAASPA